MNGVLFRLVWRIFIHMKKTVFIAYFFIIKTRQNEWSLNQNIIHEFFMWIKEKHNF